VGTPADGPLISVVLPAYETEPRYLREAIGSVRAQTYPDWRLVIVDDGSRRADIRRAITRAVSGIRESQRGCWSGTRASRTPPTRG
jgi:cellulose synthase/poly-beta-1,6-N-acetylglucosamine synthase-like glycosyltransferase